MVTQDNILSVQRMLERKQKLLSLLRQAKYAKEKGNSVWIKLGDCNVEIGSKNIKYSEFCSLTIKMLEQRITNIDYECLKLGVSPSVKEEK